MVVGENVIKFFKVCGTEMSFPLSLSLSPLLYLTQLGPNST